MPTFRLSDQDMVDMLEEIAENGGNAAARIAAIRELRSMRSGVKPQEATIARLYEVGRPQVRTKAS